MRITFEITKIDDLAFLKTYSEKLKITDFNIFMDGMIANYAKRFREKLLKESVETPKVKIEIEDAYIPNQKNEEMINYNLWENKNDAYLINDFLKDSLKFKYGISRYGEVICFQYGREKKMKYSIDYSSGNIYIFLLKKGCPNKADIATLQKYSLKVSLEELFDKIYGVGSFEKHARKHIMEIIEKSQLEWKKAKGVK